jgi:hypothetical protein
VSDGLYRVVTSYLCAGFVVEGGRVTVCAPILRKKRAYWQTVAVRLADSNGCERHTRLTGEGGVNESSPARRSADVTSAGVHSLASTSPPAVSLADSNGCYRP